jgi:hypothetical protein
MDLNSTPVRTGKSDPEWRIALPAQLFRRPRNGLDNTAGPSVMG